MRSGLIIKRREIIDKNFLKYLYPLFFILFADSVLTYAFPIIVLEELESSTTLGLIMAASSVIGIVMDLVIPKLFARSTWREFLMISIVLSILYPVFIYLGTLSAPILFLLLGSVVWGIYFEFLSFSEQGYIVDEEPKSDFTGDWSVIYVLWQGGSLLSPIIGAFLLSMSILHFSSAVVSIQSIALVISYLALVKYGSKKKKRKIIRSHFRASLKFINEVTVFRLLSSKVFSVFLVSILGGIIHASFWTIGGIYGEELLGGSNRGWIVLFIFNMSILLGTTFLIYFPIDKHKMKIAQVSLLISTIFMIPVFLVRDINLILILIAVLSLFSSFVIPLTNSIFSDLANRSNDYEIYIMSISRIAISLAYVIGPLFVGIIGDFFNYGEVISITGAILFLLTIFTIIINPKAIRLPRKKLDKIMINP